MSGCINWNRQLLALIVRSIHSKSRVDTILPVSKLKSSLHDLLISMPKEATHIPGLRKGRVAKKETHGKFPAGYITLEVLGNGSLGAPASLYVFTDQTRYLFNCGEGTQRLAHEHKMKLAKLEHIFVTNSIWRHIGGIPGVALTIQDIGVPMITLHGPPGLGNLFEGTRRFVILKDLDIRIADCTDEVENFYEDHVMRIDYIPLKKKSHPVDNIETPESVESEEEIDCIDYYAPIKGSKRHLQITQGGIEKKLKIEGQKPQPVVPSETSFCYICRPKRKTGTLLIDKCLELGVPSGPLLGKLKAGEDVRLPNGNLVRANSVRSPDAACTVFVVVDCPSEDYLDALIENPELTKYQGDVPVDNFVHVMVHFTPQHIFKHPKYQEWMGKFRISTKHLLLNELNQGMGSEAVHRLQFKLNLLDPEIFPLLHDSCPTEEDNKPTVQNQLSCIFPSTLYRYKLRPEIGLDDSRKIVIDGNAAINEIMELENFATNLHDLKSEFSAPHESISEYPKVVFLGTGSCIPNKTRNTSAILLQVSEESNVILDCGEGTYGQLVRFFGPNIDNVLKNLNCIYVSHLHADHHLGLLNLLIQRAEVFSRTNVPFQPCFLVAPHQIQSWLHLYHANFQKLKHLYHLVPTTDLLHSKSSLDPNFETKFYTDLNLTQIETVAVRHCPNSYGVALTGKEGWKITYSGDTMPADYLVTLGRNSDLLIHEATMEDELKDEAVIKMHSTTSEAIEIGRKMNAKFIMLTHFSQRYAKVPLITGHNLDANVGFAFDNMRIRLGDLWKIPKMYPLQKLMFAEDVEEMENRTAKKLRKRERELSNVQQTVQL